MLETEAQSARVRPWYRHNGAWRVRHIASDGCSESRLTLYPNGYLLKPQSMVCGEKDGGLDIEIKDNVSRR